MTQVDVAEFTRSQKVALVAQLRTYLLFLSTAAIGDPKLEPEIGVIVTALQRLTTE